MKPITKAPTDPRTPIFFCTVCETAYATAYEAVACNTMLPLEQLAGVKPGDFVEVGHGYSWSKDPRWVSPTKGYKFHESHTLVFYYMVTAVTTRNGVGVGRPYSWQDNRSLHEIVVHLAGGALCTKGEELDLVWTCYPGHHGWKKVDAPPGLAKIGAPYIGKLAGRLM